MSSKEEALKGFEKFMNETVVELMPNDGTNYDEILEEDNKAVEDYFKSDIFTLFHERIK